MSESLGMRDQWKSLPVPVRGVLLGLVVGLILGGALAAATVPRYLSADPNAFPPRLEFLELGTVLSMALGYPMSLLLGWLFFVPVPGSWIAYIIAAPTLNGAFAGGLIGSVVWGVRRLKRTDVVAKSNGV